MILNQSQIDELRQWAVDRAPSPSRLEISAETVASRVEVIAGSVPMRVRVMARAYCLLSPTCVDERRLA